MKKYYITEKIGDKYKDWKEGRSIFINAPTGAGKTWFIVNVYLQYMKKRDKRILILCNRKLLRQQYWSAIIQQLDFYEDYKDYVEVETYQNYTVLCRNVGNLKNILHKYDAVVFDEYHYFIEDSKFNPTGTFLLFQYLIEACLNKIKIFITATPDNVFDIINKTIVNCVGYFKRKSEIPESYYKLLELSKYGEEIIMDTSHFKCWEVPDKETLFHIISKSDKKTIIFIDSKDKAVCWRNNLIQKYKVSGKDIVLLNSDNIDSNSEFVMKLACTNKVNAKILITTCVIDNGISIHDGDVENLIILSDDPVSFKQMAGRIRAESSKKINLYFVSQEYKEFDKKTRLAEEELRYVEQYIKNNKNNGDLYKNILRVWSDDGESDFYKKYFVPFPVCQAIYSNPEPSIRMYKNKIKIIPNYFALEKLKRELFWKTKLRDAATIESTAAIKVQLNWLGIGPKRLKKLKSSYKERQEQKLVKLLLSVSGCSYSELKAVKKILVREFKSIIDVDTKNGSVSNEKLKQICSKYDLEFAENIGGDRKKLYFITKRQLN